MAKNCLALRAPHGVGCAIGGLLAVAVARDRSDWKSSLSAFALHNLIANAGQLDQPHHLPFWQTRTAHSLACYLELPVSHLAGHRCNLLLRNRPQSVRAERELATIKPEENTLFPTLIARSLAVN